MMNEWIGIFSMESRATASRRSDDLLGLTSNQDPRLARLFTTNPFASLNLGLEQVLGFVISATRVCSSSGEAFPFSLTP